MTPSASARNVSLPAPMGCGASSTSSAAAYDVVAAPPAEKRPRRSAEEQARLVNQAAVRWSHYALSPPFRGWLAYVAEVKEKREKERRVRHVLARFRNQKFAQSEPPPRTSS